MGSSLVLIAEMASKVWILVVSVGGQHVEHVENHGFFLVFNGKRLVAASQRVTYFVQKTYSFASHFRITQWPWPQNRNFNCYMQQHGTGRFFGYIGVWRLVYFV
jgi:hypothetical protein